MRRSLSAPTQPKTFPSVGVALTGGSDPAQLETGLSTPTKITPFKLASCLNPIPAKLVSRIQALQFVDMRELLSDNVALSEHLTTLPPTLGSHKHPEQREDSFPTTWVSSFATYVAIVAQAHPNRVKDMLAYMHLIIREATKFGSLGWMKYDAVFRRNQEGSTSPWNVIDPSLHIAYIEDKKYLHSPPADTATRQITTAMAAQWHLLQYPQRALLICNKRASFPCRGRRPWLCNYIFCSTHKGLSLFATKGQVSHAERKKAVSLSIPHYQGLPVVG